MAYQEGQYISQFLNTMPQQLSNYAQQQEQIRQFDVSSKERGRQFDALQGLRESAEARSAEQYEYGKEQRSLLSLLMQRDRAMNLERSEAISRKNKALEERSLLEKAYTGMGELGIPWTETEDEWAQRVTGYDPWDERWKPLGLPEGLEISPEIYQYINQLPAYSDPKASLMQLISGGR